MFKRVGILIALGFYIPGFTAHAETFKIEPTYDAKTITFRVDNRSIFTENISDYQDNTSVANDDVVKGSHSVYVRLGRDNDMFMIAAFKRDGNKVCAKHLMVRLRDGDQIDGKLLGAEGGRELYGIEFRVSVLT